MSIVKGEVIKLLREQRGIGLRQLASEAGIDHSVISRLERNLQNDVMLSVLASIADVFEVSLDTLTDRTNRENVPLTPELDVLISLLGEQPKAIQVHIASIISAYLANLPKADFQQ